MPDHEAPEAVDRFASAAIIALSVPGVVGVIAVNVLDRWWPVFVVLAPVLVLIAALVVVEHDRLASRPPAR